MGNRVASKHREANFPRKLLTKVAIDYLSRDMMCVIKIRSKGSTKISKIPKGVFRCILEYQLPAPMRCRLSEPYMPVNKPQDIQFPTNIKLDLNNYLIAVN